MARTAYRFLTRPVAVIAEAMLLALSLAVATMLVLHGMKNAPPSDVHVYAAPSSCSSPGSYSTNYQAAPSEYYNSVPDPCENCTLMPNNTRVWEYKYERLNSSGCSWQARTLHDEDNTLTEHGLPTDDSAGGWDMRQVAIADTKIYLGTDGAGTPCWTMTIAAKINDPDLPGAPLCRIWTGRNYSSSSPAGTYERSSGGSDGNIQSYLVQAIP